MTVNELASILKEMYENSNGEKAAMVHLFAIKYAREIRDNDIVIKDILIAAKMPLSYVVEINKGINLAKYVEVKDRYK